MIAIPIGALLLVVGAANIVQTRRYERRQHLPRQLWAVYLSKRFFVHGPVGVWQIVMAAGGLAIVGGVVYVLATGA